MVKGGRPDLRVGRTGVERGTPAGEPSHVVCARAALSKAHRVGD